MLVFFLHARAALGLRALTRRVAARRVLFGLRNQDTNETTALGAPQPIWPDPWEEVRDPSSGQIYWWNPTTNETTAVGAPKPTSPARRAAAQQQQQLQQARGPGGDGWPSTMLRDSCLGRKL